MELQVNQVNCYKTLANALLQTHFLSHVIVLILFKIHLSTLKFKYCTATSVSPRVSVKFY